MIGWQAINGLLAFPFPKLFDCPKCKRHSLVREKSLQVYVCMNLKYKSTLAHDEIISNSTVRQLVGKTPKP